MSERASLPLSLSLFAAAAALGSAGCDDTLKSVSLIEETRVLGARVEVEADETRAAPMPGERASLHFFVATPNAEPQLSYALSVCAVRPTNNGFPSCESAPFASEVQVDPLPFDARLDFQVPADIALESTPHAFASGLICPDSGLSLATNGAASCRSGVGNQVAFEFDLGGPEHGNRNPSFGADSIFLDDEPWPASIETSCDASSLPQVTAKSRHALRIDLADAAFEPLTRDNSLEPARETLLVSLFSDAGKLEHGFLSLRADTPPQQRGVSWNAPASAGTLPRLVRFYFVVRDARSGEDFTNRALCVVP